MRRDARIILGTLLLAGLWTGGGRVAEAVTALDTFRVTDVRISGLETLDRGQVLRLLDVTHETTVWGDLAAWEDRLEEHPLLASARVRRQMPGTLVVDVVERHPVALAPTPTLEPVDREGTLLPLDPAERRMDLPILGLEEPPAPGSRLLPTRERLLAAEVARLMESDTSFLQMVSEFAWGEGRNTVVARWSVPPVDFILNPGAPASRLREGLAALADAMARDPEQVPAVIDLRYADQVVVRRSNQGATKTP